MKVKLLAPAKINLYLHVVGKRPDGYHDIESMVVPISLCDTVEVERKDEGLEVASDNPDCSCGENNIAYKAAAWFFKASGIAGGAKIFIEKNIPIGAGLGGGSSDAATTIEALELLYKFKLDDSLRARLAFDIGADVPMFFVEGAKIIRGIGERVEPVKYSGLKWFVLVNPRFGVSTEQIYRQLSLSLTQKSLKNRIDSENYLERNDLQDAVIKLHPEVGELIEGINNLGFKARVSGSGPTCFAPLDSPSQAGKILNMTAQRGYRVYVVHNV